MTAATVLLVFGLSGPALADPDPVYWVVPGTPGAVSELSLPQVAQRVLGDSQRWPELLELNEGRPQADGGAVTEAGQLKAGWALVLPEGARSGEIRFGTPPGPSRAAAPVPEASGSSSLPWVIAGAGAVALGLGGGLFLMRRRRHRAGAPVVPVAGAESRESLDRALRAVAGLPSAPGVYAAVVGLDRISLRLAPALPDPPPPWQARAQGTVWEAPTWQLDAAPAAPGSGGMPLLATIGTIGGEPVVVNLGRAPGLVALTGDKTAARTRLVSFVDGVTVPVLVLGPALPASRGRVVTDVAQVEGAGPWLVAVTGALPPPALQRLSELAANGGNTTAVVVLGDVPQAAWRFAERPDGTLDAGVLGLTLDAKGAAR
ncbi:hypothetical protein [Actinoplanes sp. NPDC051494]|uniref:hypothetical protein n=1 Tax=Actinoplanes sp. NPDC051494 TaxID=3363907 RepID=UPI00379D2B49